jgi:hypothetical protein
MNDYGTLTERANKMFEEFPIVVPDHVYSELRGLKCSADGGVITEDELYDSYRSLMGRFVDWLLEGTRNHMIGPFYVTGFDDRTRTVTLQKSKNPIDCLWAFQVVNVVSDQFGFGILSERWRDEPDDVPSE